MKDNRSQKESGQSVLLREAYYIWASIPRYLRVIGTLFGIFIAGTPVVYNILIAPVREVYIKAQTMMDLIRADDDLIYWLCTSQATTTEEYKLKTAFYPLLKEYQDDRKKRLLELLPIVLEMQRIGTYASTNSVNKFHDFQDWHWVQYKLIASTNKCPASNVLSGIEVHQWENEILQSMPYNIIDFFWFYFEGFWKKGEEKTIQLPSSKKP